MTKPTLAALVEQLPRDKAALEAAEQRTSVARNDESECRNRLCATQKAIDAAVVDLRRNAPRDTEWTRARGLTP